MFKSPPCENVEGHQNIIPLHRFKSSPSPHLKLKEALEAWVPNVQPQNGSPPLQPCTSTVALSASPLRPLRSSTPSIDLFTVICSLYPFGRARLPLRFAASAGQKVPDVGRYSVPLRFRDRTQRRAFPTPSDQRSLKLRSIRCWWLKPVVCGMLAAGSGLFHSPALFEAPGRQATGRPRPWTQTATLHVPKSFRRLFA
jgi:hypothetical protein